MASKSGCSLTFGKRQLTRTVSASSVGRAEREVTKVLGAPKKMAAELGAQRPGQGTYKGNVISFQFYHARKMGARVRPIASFVGSNQQFKDYLRRGEARWQ